MGKFFVIAYLAISNVVWFYTFNLGGLKMVLLVFILLTHLNIFTRLSNYRYKGLFLLYILSILLSLYLHPPYDRNIFYFIFGFIENYIFLTLGYNYAKLGLADNKFFTYILIAIVPLCMLIITNFLVGQPDWHSPAALAYYEEKLFEGFDASIAPLYSTGFGIARTGWGNSLCQFIPLILLINSKSLKSKLRKYFIFLLVCGSVVLSQSRGGMLCMLSIFALYSFNTIKKTTTRFYILSLLLLVAGILNLYWDQLSAFLRLSGSDDLTTGRYEQYEMLPYILQNTDWTGFGLDNILLIFNRLGLGDTLHNTYLRLSIELGLAFACCFIVWLKITSKNAIKALRSTDPLIRTLSLIIISGFISGFFEPQAVWGATNWYCIWWFSIGFIINKNLSAPPIQILNY